MYNKDNVDVKEKAMGVQRQPIQARSIEKKNRIVDAGYALFEEVGYHNTNTAEIAKRAGVSTGIVYGYFSDKKDILVLVTERYLNKILPPLIDDIENLLDFSNLTDVVSDFLNYAVITHRQNAKIHEALHSMRAFDNDIDAKFIEMEDKITTSLSQMLIKFNPNIDNITEKVHLALDIIQSYSHEFVFDKHDYIDYTKMKNIVVSTVCSLFI